MEKLTIGTTVPDGKPFLLNRSVVTSTEAIIARKRRGKSYTAAVIAEELLEHKQQVGIIDPTGAHYGLRASADGQTEGYPIIVFGGDHADAPLDFRSGREMALAFIKHGFSAIWDIANLDTEEQIIFVNDFTREMLLSNRQAVKLFIDEADTYAPQMLEGKMQKVCLGSVRRLVKQGGIRGVGVTLITQRSADLSKSVLSQVDSLTVLTVSHPADMTPIVDWVSANVGKEQAEIVKEAMPKLPVGEAFFCTHEGATHVKVRQRRTFNSGATPTAGERTAVPKVMAKIDAKLLGETIAASVEEARANQPEELKKRIAALELQLKKGTPAPVDDARMDALHAENTSLAEQSARAEAARAKTLAGFEQSNTSMQTLIEEAKALLEALKAGIQEETRPHALPAPPAPAPVRTPPPPRIQPEAKEEGDTHLKAGARKMLNVVAQFHPHGRTERQVAVSAGMRHTTGTWRQYKGSLKNAGLIEIRDGLWHATPDGRRFVGSDAVAAPTSTAQVVELWSPKLKAGARTMLHELIRRRGAWLTYEQLGELTGISHTTGTFRQYVGSLRQIELIETASGQARARKDALFL